MRGGNIFETFVWNTLLAPEVKLINCISNKYNLSLGFSASGYITENGLYRLFSIEKRKIRREKKSMKRRKSRNRSLWPKTYNLSIIFNLVLALPCTCPVLCMRLHTCICSRLQPTRTHRHYYFLFHKGFNIWGMYKLLFLKWKQTSFYNYLRLLKGNTSCVRKDQKRDTSLN